MMINMYQPIYYGNIEDEWLTIEDFYDDPLKEGAISRPSSFIC